MDWLDFLAVQGTLKSLLPTPQFKSINSSVLSFLYSPLEQDPFFPVTREFFPSPIFSHQEAYTSLLASSISRQTEEARTTIPQQLKQNQITES